MATKTRHSQVNTLFFLRAAIVPQLEILHPRNSLYLDLPGAEIQDFEKYLSIYGCIGSSQLHASLL